MRIIQPGIKVRERAHFVVKFNSTKVKALMVLSSEDYEWVRSQGGWLTARQLSWLTGVSYASLLTLLLRWNKWQYVQRKKFPLANRCLDVWCYHITNRGLNYLEFNSDIIPFERYEAEMVEDRIKRGIGEGNDRDY